MESAYKSYKKELIIILIFGLFLGAYCLFVSIFRIKNFVVVSGSMEPIITTGSIISAVPKFSYNPSDIVVFRQDDRVITHRIIGSEVVGNEIFYKTKGDANKVEDDSLVNRRDILGEAIIITPYLGKIIMLFKTPVGFAAGIVLPTLLFLGLELYKLKRENMSLGI